LFDYLTCLDEVLGVASPIGILTTYKEWKVYTLDSQESRAWIADDGSEPGSHAMPHTPAKGPAPISPTNTPACQSTGRRVPCSPSIPGAEESGDPNDEVIERKLLGFDLPNPYAEDNTDFFVCLAEALIKMSETSVVKKRLGSATAALLLQPTTKSWVAMPEGELRFEATPHGNTGNYYALLELGFGRDGRVWLARDKAGAVCAIKMPHVEATTTEEHSVWQMAYPGEARSKQLDGTLCLVMPFVLPLHKLESFAVQNRLATTDSFVPMCKPLIAQAIAAFASCKLQHDDMRLCNAGLRVRNDTGNLEVVLLDFRAVTKLTEPADPVHMWTELFPNEIEADYEAALKAKVNQETLRSIADGFMKDL
jgi:hypothetical protein